MTVVYADSVFLLNALMDYLLFLATARLAGVTLRRRRYLLAAVLGGIYAICCFLPGGGFLSSSAVKGAVGVLLAVVAFGGEERLLRLTVLLFAVSCAMAGCVLGLGLLSGGAVPAVNGIFYTDIDTRVLLIAATAAYLIFTVVFRASASHSVGGEVLPVRIGFGSRTVELTALHDTGNSLRDPVSGQNVLVTSPGALDGLLSPEVSRLLTPKALENPTELMGPLRQAAPELKPRLLPFQAVGAGEGLLLAIRLDWAEIAGTKYGGMTAALSPTRMERPALWGGMVRKGDRNDRTLAAAKAFDQAGTADAPGRPLHRGQRHPAAAAVQGTGDGASGPPGRGSGPERADRT